MERKQDKNQKISTLSDIIRQNLQDFGKKEFILQIPLGKEVAADERKIRI